jgi:adenylate cyclase
MEMTTEVISPWGQKIFTHIASIGANPDDSEEIKIQKSLLVLFAFIFIIVGASWGIMYILSGEKLTGIIPLSYSMFSIFSIIYFGVTANFHLFRFSQLLLILLLPCLMMFSLGGFIDGSAVILWGLICPLGAMLFDRQSNALPWLLAYITLVAISGILQPWGHITTNIKKEQINFFFIINLVGVGTLIFLMVYYFVGKKNEFQSQSEALLLNILPKEIVKILRTQHRTIANQFEEASILFIDIVNFTPLSATMTPTQLVELLNEVFSKFDNFTEKFGLEKIKTIGDSYMVVAGVPRSRRDHAVALTGMAIEMRDYVAQNEFMGKKLAFRFGINSGPVIAGVIGRKKFSYDLWGDSVNIASRMESNGTSGEIQITQATYDLIKDDFNCSYQGIIHVKGKGDMKVWFVLNRNLLAKKESWK